ncbi:MAG TPA: aminotransferase class III-fold pyridoxal phosphate-dependent enzyme, partial [Acidobacteriota bacterium]
TPAIADSLKHLSLSTFGGNPISTAAANATIEIIEEDRLAQNAGILGRMLRTGLEEIQKRNPKTIGEVRGMGLMQALELVEDETSGDRTPAPAKTLQFFEETKRRGLLIGKGGLYSNVIRIAPPLNVTADEIQEGLKIIRESFEAMGVG